MIAEPLNPIGYPNNFKGTLTRGCGFASLFYADLDPARRQSDANLRSPVYRPSMVPF
jgi:hypothetical protein